MKIFFRNIHLYLSLAAGLVIMTCCFTGAVLVFEKELQEAFNHSRYFVKSGSNPLPIEDLIRNTKQEYPSAKIASVKVYPDPLRTVEIGISLPKKSPANNGEGAGSGGEKAGADKPGNPSKESSLQGTRVQDKPGTGKGSMLQSSKQSGGAGGGGRPTHTAFVNPYTGQVLELYNYRETFFFTMFSLHRWLLGSESSIGKTITGVATFIFLFILITGIILWWPRNVAILKQRLKIKTDASWKRLNHDFHIVLGFYSSIFLFILAFTALAWSFEWFNNGIYAVTRSSKKQPDAPRSIWQEGKQRISYDAAFQAIHNQVKDVQYYILRAPADSTGIFSATVLASGAHETAADNYYIDQYSGKLIGSLKFADKNLGQRVRSAFKPVHVGSIYGWPSKIIAFLVCILGVTFPITGTIMWLKRLQKSKQKTTIRQSKAKALNTV